MALCGFLAFATSFCSLNYGEALKVTVSVQFLVVSCVANFSYDVKNHFLGVN